MSDLGFSVERRSAGWWISGASAGWWISGERDALVTLRSAVNEALARGEGRADLEDEDDEPITVRVVRIGR